MNIIKEKYKFRFHRGSLTDSIKTMIEITSKEELCDAINKEFENLGMSFSFDDLEISYYAEDKRINWDKEYIVKIPNLGVVGFTNSLF